MRKPNPDKHNTQKVVPRDLQLSKREKKDYGVKSLNEYCDFVNADETLYKQGTIGDTVLLERFLKDRQPVQVVPPIETASSSFFSAFGST